jgi:indole-3-glycerol phosphate synthase
MILDKIVEQKKIDLEIFKKNNDIQSLVKKAKVMPKRPSFKEALAKKGLSIIGELKKASPSKGVIVENFNPSELLKKYENVVDAVSVLTEEKFFLGKPEYLLEFSKNSNLPLLRKDFIIDEIQIYEAKILGASAILLICAILTLDKIKYFMKIAKELELDVLLETHDEKEVQMALLSGADIIGINNRNLNTFEVSIDTTIKLLELIPKDKIVVSESGFDNENDIKKIKNTRVNAILVGESFMRTDDILGKAKLFRKSFVGD